MPAENLADRLARALEARTPLFAQTDTTAFRLFNGFYEGFPDLALDLYGQTVVLHDYAGDRETGAVNARVALEVLQARLPSLRAAVLKSRLAETPEERRGRIVFGNSPDDCIREHGVVYAIDPQMNRDAGFYLDTRTLRRWLLDRLRDRSVLNTFAYTGSLGVAALAGGASRVVQLDANRRFLEMTQRSLAQNVIFPGKHELLVGDFFARASQIKRSGQRFDCVILDPPFFATSSRGTVDLAANTARLINKVRPLVNHDGWLVVVNNALFVSGHDHLTTIEALCADRYLSLEEILPVPDDFTGYPETRCGGPVTDPAPFNHSTKIAVLRVKRKDP